MEHGMWEILDVLRRIHQGEKIRSIARSTQRSRRAIRRYLSIAKELGWVSSEVPPDEILAAEVMIRLKPGPQEEESEAEKLLQSHLHQLKAWLSPENAYKRGLTLTKVHALLKRQGVDVSYSTLYRFAQKHLDFGRHKGTVRVADARPGELAEVDFGRLGLIPDPETGQHRVLHALVVTLVFSRHQYVYLTHSQKLKDLINGLEDAWAFFGGVPARVCIDNLKAAVTKADRYDPTFQRTFEEYAKHRGFVIDATVPRHAKGKPHVERQVPYVRENFFRGERFLSLAHARQEALKWCLTTAGLRIHGTTRKRPLEQFEKIEQSALHPLKGERFDIPHWAEPKVHPDCHVRFQYALYSVPFKYRGRKTTVRGDSKLVRIYVDGKLIKTHTRQPKGGRSTDYADYPAEKTPYALRDANGLIAQAQKRGPSTGLFMERLLSGVFPWSKIRQAQQLLRLTDKYGKDRVDAACRRALGFDLINVQRVKGMVEKALEKESDPLNPLADGQGGIIQLPLRFLRDAKSFRQDGSDHEETKNGNQ
jgi:transposase